MKQSLEEAVGQLILGKVPALELDSENKDCLKRGIIGGITIFSENVDSREQLMDLTDSVRLFSRHPAIIAVDQEGGAVQRLEKVASAIPSMMSLAKAADNERLSLIIGLAGKQMRLLGFNCVFAPVMDVNTNSRNPIIGTRSFGSNPNLVADLGQLVIRAYLESGVLPVAKHFPGHGDSDVDSHLSLPVLKHSRERLEQVELVPFKENALITPAIMVAHLWIQALNEEKLPASLSPEVITELLRNEIGYQNLIVSDDMLMKAIGNTWGLEEACVRSVAAGMNLLLVCSNASDASAVHKAIVEAVKSGRISEDQIQLAGRARQAALNKIPPHDEIEKKKRLSILEKSVAASEPLMLESSIRGIDCSAGSGRSLFSAGTPTHFFIPQIERYPLKLKEALIAELPELDMQIAEHRYPYPNISPEQIEEITSACGENCVLLTFRAAINRDQILLAEKLAARARNKTVIACDIPYDLDLLPDWDNAFAINDPSNQAVKALAKLIARQLTCMH